MIRRDCRTLHPTRPVRNARRYSTTWKIGIVPGPDNGVEVRRDVAQGRRDVELHDLLQPTVDAGDLLLGLDDRGRSGRQQHDNEYHTHRASHHSVSFVVDGPARGVRWDARVTR